MVCCTDCQLEDSELYLECKKNALRDAVICVGWLKIISIIYYVCMYFLVHIYSKGELSLVLEVLLLLAIPLQVLHAVCLFFGALEDRVKPLEASLWLCLLTASYNTVLGTMGCIYFIRLGYVPMHYFLVFSFLMLAFSLFTVLCHDILIVYAYKQMALRLQNQRFLECVQCNTETDI